MAAVLCLSATWVKEAEVVDWEIVKNLTGLNDERVDGTVRVVLLWMVS